MASIVIIKPYTSMGKHNKELFSTPSLAVEDSLGKSIIRSKPDWSPEAKAPVIIRGIGRRKMQGINSFDDDEEIESNSSLIDTWSNQENSSLLRTDSD